MEDYKVGDLCDFISSSGGSKGKKVKKISLDGEKNRKDKKDISNGLTEDSTIQPNKIIKRKKKRKADFDSQRENNVDSIVSSGYGKSEDFDMVNIPEKKKKLKKDNTSCYKESNSPKKVKKNKSNLLDTINDQEFGNNKKTSVHQNQASISATQLNWHNAFKSEANSFSNKVTEEQESYALKKKQKMERIKKRLEESLPAKHPDAEKRTIFVGNVSVNMKRRTLMQFFNKYGPVETVRFRGIGAEEMGMSKKEAITQRKIHPDRSTMIAFVRFKNIASMEKALKANGQLLNGHHLRVDSSIRNPKANNLSIFIGNLAFDLKEEELWNVFGECGKITDARVVRSSSTGGGKGFAFVSFESKESLDLALKKDGEFLRKRPMRIKRAFKKAKIKDSMKDLSEESVISFMKQDKPKHLLDKKRELENKATLKNYSGSKVSKMPTRPYQPNKRFQPKKSIKKAGSKPRFSKGEQRKRYIARVLTGN